LNREKGKKKHKLGSNPRQCGKKKKSLGGVKNWGQRSKRSPSAGGEKGDFTEGKKEKKSTNQGGKKKRHSKHMV